MDFNAAIFDLDGTILDSMDVWEHIDIQFLKKRNLPVPENYVCDVTRSVSKMTEIERRGGKRWDKPKKAGKSRDCRGGKF